MENGFHGFASLRIYNKMTDGYNKNQGGAGELRAGHDARPGFSRPENKVTADLEEREEE